MRQWFLGIIRNAALLASIAGALYAGGYESRSAREKLDLIESGRAARGSRIFLTAAELNAWVGDLAKLHAPEGVRNPRLTLGPGTATGFANVDFLRLRQATTGEAPGWFLKNLFSGERPVKVIARFQSRDGRARVDVERVEISGVAIEGRALDLAIDAFVRPTFPYLVASEWFNMQFGVDRFTVSPAGVAVFTRR